MSSLFLDFPFKFVLLEEYIIFQLFIYAMFLLLSSFLSIFLFCHLLYSIFSFFFFLIAVVVLRYVWLLLFIFTFIPFSHYIRNLSAASASTYSSYRLSGFSSAFPLYYPWISPLKMQLLSLARISNGKQTSNTITATLTEIFP